MTYKVLLIDDSKTQLDVLKLDPTSNAEAIKVLEEAINSINNIDLTPAQQQLASIESFFDGSTKSNAIKEKLLEGFRNEEEFGYMAGYEPWEKLIFDR